MDLARVDRGHPGPAVAARDRCTVDGLSAPRGEDDLRVASHDLGRFDDAPRGGRLPAELGERVVTTGRLDQLGHPADPRDHRLRPLLEIHPRAVRPDARVLAYLGDLVTQVAHQVPCGLRTAERSPDQENGPKN